MKTSIILLSFVLAFQPITAEASNFLSDQSLISAVSGKSLTWYDGSKSHYAEDGSYTFTGKSKISGTWSVRGAWLCVSFSVGKEECARYFYKKGHLFAQNTFGRRFKAH